MYYEYDDVDYHEEDDIDLSDYECVEDEDALDKDLDEGCSCANGCNFCLMTSYTN